MTTKIRERKQKKRKKRERERDEQGKERGKCARSYLKL